MNLLDGLRRIGEPAGTSETDWVTALKRNPVSITAMPGGMRLLQWRSGRYQIQQIAVLFDAHYRFVEITHRYQC